jgi:hypothetical protein
LDPFTPRYPRVFPPGLPRVPWGGAFLDEFANTPEYFPNIRDNPGYFSLKEDPWEIKILWGQISKYFFTFFYFKKVFVLKSKIREFPGVKTP